MCLVGLLAICSCLLLNLSAKNHVIYQVIRTKYKLSEQPHFKAKFTCSLSNSVHLISWYISM